MNSELLEYADRILAALLNGGYQGLLIAVLVWVCLKLTRQANAATRHAVWLQTLVVIAALPVFHLVLSAHPGKTTKSATTQKELPATAAVSNTQSTSEASDNNAELQAEIPESYSELVLAPDTVQPFSITENREIEGFAVVREIPVRRPDSHSLSLTLPFWAALAACCGVAVLAFVRSGLLAWQFLRLLKLKRNSEPAPQVIRERFMLIMHQLSARREVDLLVSPEIRSPMVAGFTRPAILVPQSMMDGENSDRLDPILRHELAHIQRFDDWSNLLQQCVKAIFSFHPAVLYIARRLSIEREIACDDHVLHSGHKPREYALVLAEFASRCQGRDWTVAPAAWSRKSQLTERVNMILQKNRSTSPRLALSRLGFIGGVAAIFATLMLAGAPRLSFATEPKADPVSANGIAPLALPSPETPPAAVAMNTQPASTPPAAVAVAGVEEPDALPRVPSSGRRVKGTAFALAPAAEDAPPSPDVPKPPRAGSRSEDSLDQRLQRLEQMVEQLVRQQSRNNTLPTPKPVPVPVQPGVNAYMALPEPPPSNLPHPPGQPHPRPNVDVRSEIGISTQTGPGINWQREYAKSADWEAKNMGWKNPGDVAKMTLEQRRKSLEMQHKSLEKALQGLERQMEQLEREQDKLEAEQQKLEAEREKIEAERQKMQTDRDKIETNRQPKDEKRSNFEEDNRKK